MPGPWEPETWCSPDGAKLSLRRWPSVGAPLVGARSARGSIVLVHGWGDHAGRLATPAEWFAQQGLDAYALDQRGHGHSPGRRGHVDRFAQYLADLVGVRKMASLESPGPQFLLGHSFGGFIVLRYLEMMPYQLAGAIVVTPFVDFFRPPPRWKTVMARVIADLMPRLPIPTGLDYDHLTRDPATVEKLRADPMAHERMTPRAYLETMAALEALRSEKDRITVPLLLLLAGEDRIVSTPSARGFARALRGDVTVREYPGMYHNVFHEADPSRVYADMAAWLERRLATV
jgi:lysophospholipase